MKTKSIEAYSLFEFCQKVQEAITEGWRFDLETNANAPTSFGAYLHAIMVKAEDEVVTEVAQPLSETKPTKSKAK